MLIMKILVFFVVFIVYATLNAFTLNDPPHLLKEAIVNQNDSASSPPLSPVETREANVVMSRKKRDPVSIIGAGVSIVALLFDAASFAYQETTDRSTEEQILAKLSTIEKQLTTIENHLATLDLRFTNAILGILQNGEINRRLHKIRYLNKYFANYRKHMNNTELKNMFAEKCREIDGHEIVTYIVNLETHVQNGEKRLSKVCRESGSEHKFFADQQSPFALARRFYLYTVMAATQEIFCLAAFNYSNETIQIVTQSMADQIDGLSSSFERTLQDVLPKQEQRYFIIARLHKMPIGIKCNLWSCMPRHWQIKVDAENIWTTVHYKIVNSVSGMFLTDTSLGQNHTELNSQKWTFTYVDSFKGNQFFRLQSGIGNCLTFSINKGIGAGTCDSQNNHSMEFQIAASQFDASNGYKIIAKRTNRCVDSPKREGSVIHQWHCMENNENQKWHITFDINCEGHLHHPMYYKLKNKGLCWTSNIDRDPPNFLAACCTGCQMCAGGTQHFVIDYDKNTSWFIFPIVDHSSHFRLSSVTQKLTPDKKGRGVNGDWITNEALGGRRGSDARFDIAPLE